MLERGVELTIAIEIFIFATSAVFGSIFMILSFCFCSSKKQRKSRFPRLVLYLGIGDLLLSIAILFSQSNYLIFPDGNYNADHVFSVAICKAQAFAVLFTQLSKLFWLLSFSLTIFLQVTLIMFSRKLSNLFQKYFVLLEVGMHLVNWGIPLIVSTCLLFTGHLGKAFIGCWLLGSSNLQFFIYYGPLVGIFFVTLVLYLVVIVLVCISQRRTKTMNARKDKSLTRFIKKNRVAMQLSTYSLVFLLLWAPAMAGSLYNYITNQPQLWMLFPQFIWTWGGFIDGIVFSLKKSPKFRFLLTVCCFGSKNSDREAEIVKGEDLKEALLINSTENPGSADYTFEEEMDEGSRIPVLIDEVDISLENDEASVGMESDD
uniref:G-protein coupled receptors family 1 profile domain-containing protein n=1 Tax=Percolomonas cosmopolitus TaxID=63605 RepID=A0A7S1KQX0_9EUKA|mmetsp:Transcript_5358/g.20015  ORF Transcript_5358/g.20015 Transcript_5358/m.20015 type:complete len:373 (+) Transcript_5358:104-1222(+)